MVEVNSTETGTEKVTVKKKYRLMTLSTVHIHNLLPFLPDLRLQSYGFKFRVQVVNNQYTVNWLMY